MCNTVKGNLQQAIKLMEDSDRKLDLAFRYYPESERLKKLVNHRNKVFMVYYKHKQGDVEDENDDSEKGNGDEDDEIDGSEDGNGDEDEDIDDETDNDDGLDDDEEDDDDDALDDDNDAVKANVDDQHDDAKKGNVEDQHDGMSITFKLYFSMFY